MNTAGSIINNFIFSLKVFGRDGHFEMDALNDDEQVEFGGFEIRYIVDILFKNPLYRFETG